MVNFRIVEGDSDEFYSLVPRFVELYSNRKISVIEIRQQMGIPTGLYDRLREYCFNEGLVKPRYKDREKSVVSPRYYYHNGCGFRVARIIKGARLEFGTYKREDDAKRIVECLKECDWDKSQLDRIKKEVLG